MKNKTRKITNTHGDTVVDSRPEPRVLMRKQVAKEMASQMIEMPGHINTRRRLVKGWASVSLDTHLPFDSFDGCRQLDASAAEIWSRYNLPSPQSPVAVCRTINATVPTSMPIAAPTPSDATEKNSAPDYFVPRALAKRWSVCVDKVLMFIRTGELRAFNVASATSSRPRYRISIDEVRRFEEKTRSAAPPHAAGDRTARRRKKSVMKPRRTYF